MKILKIIVTLSILALSPELYAVCCSHRIINSTNNRLAVHIAGYNMERGDFNTAGGGIGHIILKPESHDSNGKHFYAQKINSMYVQEENSANAYNLDLTKLNGYDKGAVHGNGDYRIYTNPNQDSAEKYIVVDA